MKKIKAFTLLEVLLSVVILSMFIGIIISIYTNLRKTDASIANKRILISEASDLMDKIHEAAINYNIDYEEYFNVQRQWSYSEIQINDSVDKFITWYSWNWFTSYWNSWNLYYCWNTSFENGKYKIRQWNSSWCATSWIQKYMEYHFQHYKAASNTLNTTWDKNAFQKKWPIAISPNVWLNYLYLISNEWTERYYFRQNCTWENIDNKYCRIEVLKMEWLDCWKNRDFNSWWAYDWFIDYWFCDSSKWFVCNGSWCDCIGTWCDSFSTYNLPKNENEWWVRLTNQNVNVNDFRIDIYPTTDPYLCNDKDACTVIDPYAKITFTMNLVWYEDKITLSTILSFKSSYSRFMLEDYDWYIPEI